MDARMRSVHAALTFIEDHLHEDITVGDIASAAGYSLYHFIRTFNQVVQHSPYDFLMRRRLSEAAQELIDTDRRILDIAVDYSFGSHETFSRAFKRMFDLSPSQWRDGFPDHAHVLLPRLTEEYLAHINHTDFVRPVLKTVGGLPRVCFMHRGGEESLQLTLSYIHHTWLPQSEVHLACAVEPGHFQHNADVAGMAAFIPVREFICSETSCVG